MKTYTSLHNHTHFSNLRLIDSINSVEALIDRAFELGLNGVAITDHDSVSAHVRAISYYNKKYEEHKDSFKLILGNEIYIARSDLNSETHEDGEPFYHFLLLAKDRIGHDQIREISTRAWRRAYHKNMMRVPTFKEDLEEVIGSNPGHVIATTACLAGYPGRMFISGQGENADPFIEYMFGVFGKENFYLEIQPSVTQPDQINFNNFMIERYWEKYKDNFIFTTDSHYLKKEDAILHKWFLQSAPGGKNRDVEEFYSSAYMMGMEEIYFYFKNKIDIEKINKMVDNTNKIGNMIEPFTLSHPQIVPTIKYGKISFTEEMKVIIDLFEANGLSNYEFLKYYINADNDADLYLAQLFLEGYYNRIYGSDDGVSVADRMDRLNYELEQIYEISKEMDQHLSDYFITMAKMMEIVWKEGDSIVGVSRGSAAGFLLNYLVGITQMDPQTQSLYIPPWRFIHKDRPGLPDIDVDTESTKRTKIFNKLQEYFNTIGADVVNVCTFGTLGSKKSIQTAARGLDIDDSVVSYLNSMIPNERGFDFTLSQCYYGDENNKPIKAFVEEMDENPDLWRLASAIEGLIVQLGVHASGILVVNGDIIKHNSIMRTSRGVVVSAYDLDDSEEMGGLKYDMLTVQALDKIRATLNYLLEDKVIEWQGSLRETYDKYLLPRNLNYTEPKMWEMLGRGEIIDVFQFDTAVGSQAVKIIQPKNVAELAVANSVMRLMAQDSTSDLPLDVYARQKNDLGIWYREMQNYGLKREEIEVLEPYLRPLYGVADSQEVAMQLTMDPKIADFSVTEANNLRRAIGKKDYFVLEETKKMFFEKGREIGTRQALLDYVWFIQLARQFGYSFSILHTLGYSTIALQEMNLAYFYPSIYWKTACLSVNAGAINEEDYYNLLDEGIIELDATDEEDKRTQNKVQYGKIATAISMFRNQNIKIETPDINLSRMGFTPDVENNSILYGIKGIIRVGEKVIDSIIVNRPYNSLEDFLKKMTDAAGRKLISKDRVVNLIKAGAFDRIENKSRKDILTKYIKIIADQKNKLTLSNFLMLMRKGFVPDILDAEKKVYNFTKYIRQFKEGTSYYILDEVAQEYFFEKFEEDKVIKKDGVVKISQSWWDGFYNNYMNKVRSWLRDNHDELLNKLNESLFLEEYEKYAQGDILDWELESLNFFYSGHPLQDLELPIKTSKLDEIKEGEAVGYWNFNGKRVPELRLHTIIGTVIERDKAKGIVTLSTPEGVIDIKLYKQLFAKYLHESDGLEQDENFFEKGTHLAVTGVKRGNVFAPKKYKKTPIELILKIVLDKDRKFVEFRVKS